MENRLAIAVLLLFFICGVWYFLEFIYGLLKGEKNISSKTVIQSLRKDIYLKRKASFLNKILTDHNFRYYLNLNEKNKIKFLKRVSDFIVSKKFINCGMPDINPEHKVLISASAVQLTFGLDRYMLSCYSKIYVFPNKYYSKSKGQYHKGEVNLKGEIAFSFEDFVKGYNIPDDGINLGLHEMAHALKFDRLLRKSTDSFFNDYFHKWQQSAFKEFKNLNDNEDSIFRDYASTNMNEFFAVCIEYFFEKPELFRQTLPDLYERLTILLNQDPLGFQSGLITPRDLVSQDNAVSVIPDTLLFKSKYPFNTLFFKIKWLLMLSMILLFSYFGQTELFFFATGLFILNLLLEIFKAKYFSVYKNCFTVNTLLNKGNPRVFLYKSLVVVCAREKINRTINVRYIKNGKIKSKSYPFSLDKKDFDNFVLQLKLQGVLVADSEV